MVIGTKCLVVFVSSKPVIYSSFALEYSARLLRMATLAI